MNLNDYFTGPRVVVKIAKYDLLPCAHEHASVNQGDGQRRPKQCGPDMGISIAVAPSFVMVVINILGRNSLDRFFQVIDNPAFKFNGCQCCGGACDE